MLLRNMAVGMFLVLSLTIDFLGQSQTRTGCLSYEPSIIKLTGNLTRKTFPGPPNYESVRNGDQPETYWLLNLVHPICVAESKTDGELNPAMDVRSLQLVFTGPATYKKYKELLGKQVVATGTLFAAQTGHHHTPVLLTVVGLAKVK